jgi:hypothetical protein
LNAAHDALVADALSDTHDPSRYCKVRLCWSTIRPGLIFHGGSPQKISLLTSATMAKFAQI